MIPPDIIAQMKLGPVTAGFVADRLGIGPRQATKLLKAVEGVTESHGRYRIGVSAPLPIGRMCIASDSTGSTLCTGRDRA